MGKRAVDLMIGEDRVQLRVVWQVGSLVDWNCGLLANLPMARRAGGGGGRQWVV